LNRNEKKGVVHLYKKYDGTIKEIQMEHKSGLAANQIEIKTQVLFFNRLHSSQLNSLMVHMQ
jgi:peptide deformylase